MNGHVKTSFMLYKVKILMYGHHMTIYERIRQIRKQHALSQEAVAAALGMSRANYAKKERGEVSLLADDLIKLAKFYGMELSELLSGVTVEPRSVLPEDEWTLEKGKQIVTCPEPSPSELAAMISPAFETRLIEMVKKIVRRGNRDKIEMVEDLLSFMAGEKKTRRKRKRAE